MRIGELANRANVGVETIRFYESRGLVPRPARPRNGGYRDYPDALVARIRFIRSAQQLGFSLREVSELLTLERAERAECADMRALAERKLSEVQAKIAELDRIGDALRALIETCPGGGPLEGCSILKGVRSLDGQATEKSKGD